MTLSMLALAKVVQSRQKSDPMLHAASGLPQPLPWISSGRPAAWADDGSPGKPVDVIIVIGHVE